MLPVTLIADAIAAHLRTHNRLVLTAPTGSGKTTQVPQVVHRAAITDRRIVVLQPRRLATRMVAARVAHELGVSLGELVGYQTRHESAVSRESRIVFMTEGLFLRQLQHEPNLPGVGCVILDEFHERSVAADLTLALLRRRQDAPPDNRRDLRLIVMSATLDAAAVCDYLECESLHAEGRAYPVDVSYLPMPPTAPVWDLAADALTSVLDRDTSGGHVLVFMPRVFEINRTLDACKRIVARSGEPIDVVPLHGSLPPREQDRAVAPSARRKVIVATNVAETSITIDGVTAVIDSGLANQHRYDAGRGLNLLRVEPISKASADQRAGRAGRTAPGVCIRLWTSKDHGFRDDQTAPEVRRVEFAEPMLTLLSMGVADPATFDWLDRPPEDSITQARELLLDLGAIAAPTPPPPGEVGRGNAGNPRASSSESNAQRDVTVPLPASPKGGGVQTLTPRGKQMAAFPAHPRLARMMLDAADRRCLGRAVVWAALIAERDIATRDGAKKLHRLAEPGEPASDLAIRERALLDARAARFDRDRCESLGVHAIGAREVDRVVRQYEKLAQRMNLPLDSASGGATEDVLRCVVAAYADHIAIKLDADRPHCAMPGRKRVTLDPSSIVRHAGPIVALDAREVGKGDGRETVLSLASEIDICWLRELHPQRFTTRSEPVWNAELRAVEQVDRTLYGDLVIASTARPTADPGVAAAMLVDRIMSGELRLAKWDDAVDQWLARVRCVAGWFPERNLIRYDDDELRVVLLELVDGATRWNQVADRGVLDAMRNALDWADQQFIDKSAPTHLSLPSGHRMPITYAAGAPPRGSAKIQQLYGLNHTPTISGGRIGIVLEILGPNYRPVQVTADLASFWANTYPDLRKELKRRYPKHEWR